MLGVARHVEDPVERDARVDGGVGVLEARLPLGVPRRERRERGEVPTGGVARDREEPRAGRPPYSAACALVQAIARFTSTMWSGQVDLGLSR